MRFGCCGSIDVIEQLKEIGYDYIELGLSGIAALSEEEFSKLKERVESSGIKCEACNGFFPGNLRLTGPEVNMEKIAEYTEKALYRANRLGVQIVVFGSGMAKQVPEGFQKEKAWEQLVELSRNVIDPIAKKYGITIVIEPLRSQECNIINTVKEGLKLAKEVDRENIKLLADYYHMAFENEDPSIVLEAKDYLKHIHIARKEGRAFPKDINEDKYAPFIECLKKINYMGRISIEAKPEDFYSDAVKSLEFLKKHFA